MRLPSGTPRAPIKKKIGHLTRRHRFHVAHSTAHLIYCASAIAEGHAVYAAAAGLMLIFAVFQLIGELDCQ